MSIVDLGAGQQPVFNESGRACVVFNGEIYNHRELRRDLRARGHVFRTSTDTEVVIHLYEEYGDACVEKLDGMFAFAVLDGSRVFLARDRFGIKPLYFAHLDGEAIFLFASEIKALLRCPALTPRLDRQTFADVVALGHPTGGDTFFEGVRLLEPGHTMVVSCEDRLRVAEPVRYWFHSSGRDGSADGGALQAELEDAIDRAVQSHIQADVDVGLTLSGGLDSSLLAMFARRYCEKPIATFTIADHDSHPDVVQACHVAAMIGSDHRTVILTFEDYLAAIPALAATEEQPCSLFGVPFFVLCRAIAERVKVSLHGEGADELFGGYAYHLDPEPRLTRIRHRLPLLKTLGLSPSPRAAALIEQLIPGGSLDNNLDRLLALDRQEPLERQHLLPVDRGAMAASVEMRVPYLDTTLAALAGRMPLSLLVRPDLGIRKYILRKLALDRFGSGLADIVMRGKYGAPAAGLVLLDRFDRLCQKLVSDAYVSTHEFGAYFRTKRELVMFDLFIDIFMKHRGEVGCVGSIMGFLHERGGVAQPFEA